MKHVQVRLSDGEYEALAEAAGPVPLQRFALDILLAGVGKSAPSITDGLRPKDRALLERYANALRLSKDGDFLGIIETMLDRIDVPDAPPEGKRKAG